MDCSTPGFPVHHQLPELAQTHVHQVSDFIHPSYPLSSSSPPAISLSQQQGLFQGVSPSHQVAKVLEFQLQHQSFEWMFRTISLRTDWLDLLAVQGTLKSFLQHHSSKVSILWCSAFFMGQLSHPLLLWRRKWQPTPVFLPGESQGWWSLVGCRLWGHTELDTTEATWQLPPIHDHWKNHSFARWTFVTK